MSDCQCILECYAVFSGVKVSIRLFNLFMGVFCTAVALTFSTPGLT